MTRAWQCRLGKAIEQKAECNTVSKGYRYTDTDTDTETEKDTDTEIETDTETKKDTKTSFSAFALAAPKLWGDEHKLKQLSVNQ